MVKLITRIRFLIMMIKQRTIMNVDGTMNEDDEAHVETYGDEVNGDDVVMRWSKR